MSFCLKLYGLPGGNQVDGLPPAASDRRASCSLKVIRLLVELVRPGSDYGPIRKFFWGFAFLGCLRLSILRFHAIAT